jgi:acetylornithine deacetylase/succinyl-diaminopimelate desuccinylase-like protein
MTRACLAAALALACSGAPGRSVPPSPPRPAAAISGSAQPVATTAPKDPIASGLLALSERALMADVGWLAGPELRGRGLFSDDARKTADRIAEEFRAAGLEVRRQAIPGAPGQSNVIGILRGGDEVVVVCAHYDHLGVDRGVVYPGADDNASGTAVLLSLARAVGRSHHGRTIVFLASGAEEAGLLGAGAYVRDPAFPLHRTKAMINFDMVGRNFFELGGGRSGTVGVIGLENPGIEPVVRAAADAEAVEIMAMTADTLRFFGFDGRTDDYWFRKLGVPTVHFSTGMHRDYHEPTDTAERLKPDQMLRVARVSLRVLLELGRLDLR